MVRKSHSQPPVGCIKPCKYCGKNYLSLNWWRSDNLAPSIQESPSAWSPQLAPRDPQFFFSHRSVFFFTKKSTFAALDFLFVKPENLEIYDKFQAYAENLCICLGLNLFLNGFWILRGSGGFDHLMGIGVEAFNPHIRERSQRTSFSGNHQTVPMGGHEAVRFIGVFL